LLSSLEELITKDHRRPTRTLVQEMNISITNAVEVQILCYKERSILLEASKRTQDWFKENLQEVWDMEGWPPSSPDYSLLDDFVWGVSEL
jgi:hypothetical protein